MKLKKRNIGKNDMLTDNYITKGSGNVFADLGLEDAEQELAKAKIAQALRRLIKLRGLTQTEAASLLGTDQARISQIMNGKLASMTYDRLIRFLNALDHTVNIEIIPISPHYEKSEQPIRLETTTVTVPRPVMHFNLNASKPTMYSSPNNLKGCING